MSASKLLSGRVEMGAIFGTIAVVLIFMISTHGEWLNNLPSVLALLAILGIIAIGQSVLMITGEVDLSVGSVFAFVAIAFVTLLDKGTGLALAIVLSLAAGAAVGVVNGYITTRFRVPSMIVTMGAMFIYRGIVHIVTKGQAMSLPRDYREDSGILLIGGKWNEYPHSIALLLLVTAVFTFILARTKLGGNILAVGGDPQSALANGVSPAKIKITAFALCSVLVAVAAIVSVCFTGAVYSTSGKQVELEAIAAAVMGGCALRGGVGSIWGPVLSAFILASLKGGLMMMGAPTYWYISLVGAILILFLIAARFLGPKPVWSN